MSHVPLNPHSNLHISAFPDHVPQSSRGIPMAARGRECYSTATAPLSTYRYSRGGATTSLSLSISSCDSLSHSPIHRFGKINLHLLCPFTCICFYFSSDNIFWIPISLLKPSIFKSSIWRLLQSVLYISIKPCSA
jgi:hypothetical protein